MLKFGRVGGGIFTKAADFVPDLAGKIVKNMDENSIQNLGDNVKNVGDITSMGSDFLDIFLKVQALVL